MQATFLPRGRADSRPRRRGTRNTSALLCASAASVFTVASIGAFAAPNGAGGGPVEITQARALNGAVTPGDAAGFLVTISAPGSYRLMSTLIVPDLNTTAIVITARDVTLDLNGFTVSGPQSCGIDAVPSCVHGAGDGIVIVCGTALCPTY